MRPMRPDIVPGATFPDYELTDQTGKRRKLSDLQGSDPMILLLSRGAFCPKDRRQMEGLLQLYLDIAEYTDPPHNPMIPHTFVLEPGLVVYKIYNGYWFFGRPTVEELRIDLRAVLKKCRPDWDISKPGMRELWQKGEKARFYPYGKTYAEVFANQA